MPYSTLKRNPLYYRGVWYSDMTHLITTTNDQRLTTWQHVFNTDMLPVLSAAPRPQAMQGREVEVLAYDLALSRLTEAQRQRFAGYLRRKYGMVYGETLADLNGRISWPIEASIDVSVVEPAAVVPLASLFGGWYERWINRRRVERQNGRKVIAVG